jgi:hypothetical protein
VLDLERLSDPALHRSLLALSSLVRHRRAGCRERGAEDADAF